MRTIFILSSLIILISFTLIQSEIRPTYIESEEHEMSRLKFGQNYTNLVTKGKVVFEYEPSKGIYCKANKDIANKEFVFKIPKEFIFCFFDMFPFKFELKEAVHDYFIQKFGGKQNNETQTRTTTYLFTYGLMYLNYDNKEIVKDELSRLNLGHYIIEQNPHVKEYFETLPTTLYTLHSYTDDEFKLLKILGFQIDEGETELESVFKHVQKHIAEKYPDYKVTIYNIF
jgi:hypothetical protein